jgi:hypothetical protein
LRNEFQNNASDSFSSTQQIILENNYTQSRKQINLQRELLNDSQHENGDENDIIPFYLQRSVIHFSTLTDHIDLILFLIGKIKKK